MAVSDAQWTESRVMQTISRHLESLKDTFEGDELRGLIARTLRRHNTGTVPDRACLIDLYGELKAYANDPLTLPNMRIRARLLQQQIAPYLPENETESDDPERPREPVLELVTPTSAERRADTRERAAEEQAEKYRMLQRSENDAWHAIYGTVKDYEKLKQAWTKSLSELAQQREALEQKLVQTTEQLTRLEIEHEQVRTELERARQDAKRPRQLPRLLARAPSRSVVLPKRDAFLRRLDTEIQRVQRSGAPLALALIQVPLDSDGDTGEALLRGYTHEIASSFRAYDVVALCQRNQFSVLLPDTTQTGALRALEKARKRAASAHVRHGDARLPLAPFTGVVVFYTGNAEDAAAFMARAERSLKDAARDGAA